MLVPGKNQLWRRSSRADVVSSRREDRGPYIRGTRMGGIRLQEIGQHALCLNDDGGDGRVRYEKRPGSNLDIVRDHGPSMCAHITRTAWGTRQPPRGPPHHCVMHGGKCTHEPGPTRDKSSSTSRVQSRHGERYRASATARDPLRPMYSECMRTRR